MYSPGGVLACRSLKLATEHKFIAQTQKFLQGFEENIQEKLKLNKFWGLYVFLVT